MKFYTYRGYMIIKNDTDKESKWYTIDDMDIRGNTINEVKNRIDDRVGGYATVKIPKRRWKDEGLLND